MNKKIFLTIIFSMLLIHETDAQGMFQKKFGGIKEDEGWYVQQTIDGGYIMTGTTKSFLTSNAGEIYLIKTDAYGDLLWTRTFRENPSLNIGISEGHCVQQTADSGYIITGEMFDALSSTSSDDVCLIKTDSNGNLLWSKAFDHDYDRAHAVRQTTDGGYIITGESEDQSGGHWHVFLIKTDASGDTLWTKVYDGGDSQGYSVEQTMDGGYILGGSTSYSSAAFNIQVIKTDAAGNMLWRKRFGGTGTESGRIWQTTDGGYIIAGQTSSFGAGFDDVLLIKTDSTGNILWSKTYGGTGAEYAIAFQQTLDGGFIIAGSTTSFGAGFMNFFLIKTDTAGDTLWTRVYGGTGRDACVSAQQTTDSGFVLTGFSWQPGDSSLYLIKTDANGNSGCDDGSMALIIGSPSIPVINMSIALRPSWTYFAAPVLYTDSGGTAYTLCPTGLNEIKTSNSFLISPNPSTGNFVITFPGFVKKGTAEIFDVYGKKFFESAIFNAFSKEIQLKNISPGIYFVKIADACLPDRQDKNQLTRKLLIR